MADRGVIRNREYANQVRDFSGLKWENITPTDIDGLIEYHNICYVVIETKYEHANLPVGQRLAIDRMNRDLSKVKPILSIISTHNSQGDIDVANTTVTEFCFGGIWHISGKGTTTYDLVDRFLKWAVVQHELTGEP